MKAHLTAEHPAQRTDCASAQGCTLVAPHADRTRPASPSLVRLSLLGVLALLCLGVLAAPAHAASTYVATASGNERAPISPAKAFVFPPATRCVRGRTLTFDVRKLKHVTWAGATVKINGTHFKTIGAAQLSRPVKLTGLPTGKFVLSVTARATDGRSVTKTQTYHACSTFPQSGSYSGADSQGGAVAFDVSTDRHHVQDVTVSPVDLSCSDGSSTSDSNFSIPQATIASNGSFTATSTQNGMFAGSPATITYTFTGRFQPSNVTGQLREKVMDTGGSSVTCTSNNLPWTTTRNQQGSQAPALALAGSYSGADSQGGAVAFDVSTDRHHVQDVTVSPVDLSCSDGSSTSDSNFSIPQATIASNGSFTATSTQNGMFAGSPATITYTFTGHFHGLDTSGRQRAAGQLRENVMDTGGSSVTCTSNNLPWTTTWDQQGSQAPALALAGSYSGADSQGGAVAFDVSTDRHHVQDVTVSPVDLSCSDGSSTSDSNFSIPQATIASNGSFTATSTQNGMFAGSPATITYTFTGHFHGLDTSGRQRAAGQLRENVMDTGGSSVTCTSNNLPWTTTS